MSRVERNVESKRNMGILVLLALIIVSLGVYVTVHFVNAETVREQITLGNKFYEEQKYEEAIIAFETALEIDPENVEARIGLANSYKALENVVEARKVLIAGIEISPKEPSVYLALSDIHIEENNISDAVNTLDKGLGNTGSKEIQTELQNINNNMELVSDREEVQLNKTAQLKVIYHKQTNKEATDLPSEEEKSEQAATEEEKEKQTTTEEATTSDEDEQEKDFPKKINVKQPEQTVEEILVEADWVLDPALAGKLKDKKGSTNIFTGVKNGEEKVVAKIGSIEKTRTIQVKDQVLEELEIVASIVKTTIGKEIQLKAIGKDANGKEMNISPEWSILDGVGSLKSRKGQTNTFVSNEIGKSTIEAVVDGKKFVISLEVEAETFTLSTLVSGNGSIVSSPTGNEFKNGETVSLQAVAADGWEFVGWEGGVSSDSAETSIIINENKTVRAIFKQKEQYFTLQVKKVGQGNVATSPSSDKYKEGTKVTVKATANDGWEFDHWEGNASGSNPEIQVTMDDAKEITAVFVEKQVTYTLNTTVEGNGSIKRSPILTHYADGSVVTLTAIPEAGWRFDHWEGNAQGKNKQITVTMNESKNIKAVFVKDFVFHSLSISTEGQGTVEKSPNQESYKDGDIVNLKAIAAEGWVFDHWEGSISGNNPNVTVKIDGAKVIKAVFVKKKMMYALNTDIVGNGVIQKNPAQSKYEEGTNVTLTAVPDAGWLFDHWEGDIHSDKKQVTIQMNSTKNVKAVFVKEIKYYQVSVEIEGQGTVYKDPEQSSYQEGQQVKLTAVAANGWQFDHWERDLQATSNVVTLTVNSHKSIKAVFVKEKVKYKLETTVTGEGTITRNPAAEIYEEGTNVTLTATPSSGWVFYKWSGSITGTESQTVLNMDSDKQVEAIFIQTGHIQGVVKNARNGQIVPGASINLREGENAQTGSILQNTTSNANGSFTFSQLRPGTYTLEISAQNYTTKFSTVEIVSGQTANITESIMPEEEVLTEFQVVLSWGATPEDLDAHLTGPLADGQGRFHIYFGNKQYVESDGVTYAQLDTDVTTGGGPETVTTFKQVDGIYRYFVRNFTGTPSITTSNARVELYKQGQLIRTFHVPTTGDGLYWHVFEIENGVLRVINELANEGMQ